MTTVFQVSDLSLKLKDMSNSKEKTRKMLEEAEKRRMLLVDQGRCPNCEMFMYPEDRCHLKIVLWTEKNKELTSLE